MSDPHSVNVPSLRRRILGHLARGVPEAVKSFDAKSGRFLAENGGWAVTRQDIIFPLALLYTSEGTRYHASRPILDLALRGGDALRDAQGPSGDWEFIKIDGSSWGRVFMPWSIYHWLEAFALLRDSLDARRRRRWSEGLTLACDGVARELAKPFEHNIPCWKGMSLVRAAQLFDRPDWHEIGVRQERFAADHQHPDGYWPEGDAPTTHYNLVYVHAIGLYHAFTGDERVLPALRRAADFHAAFTYPDGASVETVDGRVKYTPEPSVTGLPGLGVTPAGRALVSLIIQAATQTGAEAKTGKASRSDTSWRKNQAQLSPHLASAFQHLRDGTTAPLPSRALRSRTLHRRRALVVRDRPWFACVSGYVPGASARHDLLRNRWIMTRSNLFSLFHDRLGLLIGGGNSKHDPFFATFTLSRGGVAQIEPDAVSFTRRGRTEVARFRFGRDNCLLRLTPRSATLFEITFELPAVTARRCQATGGFTLRVPAGERVRWSSKGPQPADASATIDPQRAVQFHWTPIQRHRECLLESRHWRLSMPIDSGMHYPAYPFNPYAINDAAPPAEAVVSIHARFDRVRIQRFLLRII
ncbi:MAG: hypothetical protein K8S99_11800 [Planctomycetes bacterium]|nr:hypothetical protein [Planctomycetota bacterium]